MKKLLTLVFVLCCGVLAAQYSSPQNSIAVVVGPNGYDKLTGGCDGCGSYSSKVGFSAGLEYTLEIAKHWHLKAGLRYNYLTYESVFPIYDPSLPQQEFVFNETARCWQYSAGIRWISKPKIWRFYADCELGLSDLREDEGEPKHKPQPAVGIGFGLAWQKADSKLAVFAQPNVRYVFHQPNSVLSRGDAHFLMPVFEMGVRRYF